MKYRVEVQLSDIPSDLKETAAIQLDNRIKLDGFVFGRNLYDAPESGSRRGVVHLTAEVDIEFGDGSNDPEDYSNQLFSALSKNEKISAEPFRLVAGYVCIDEPEDEIELVNDPAGGDQDIDADE